jgi:catechol 2,3-dioxygenase-like lactoylglutathione lyase family enzyme
MKLSAVRIFVNHIDEASAFYERVLGLSLKASSSDYPYAVFELGGCNVVIETIPPDADDEDKALIGRFTGISFEVDDIGATYETLLSKGVHFTAAPETQFWGGILATFTDRSGNVLQMVELPKP